MNRLTQFVGRIFNPDPRVALPSAPNVEMLRANMLNSMKAVEGLRAKLIIAEEARDYECLAKEDALVQVEAMKVKLEYLLSGLAVGCACGGCAAKLERYNTRFGK